MSNKVAIADAVVDRLRALRSSGLEKNKKFKIAPDDVKKIVDSEMNLQGYNPKNYTNLRSAVFSELGRRGGEINARLRRKERRDRELERQATFDEIWESDRINEALKMAFERRDHLLPDF